MEGGAMPRRGLRMFDGLWCSVQWKHCLSAGIRNPQVTYDDEDGNDYADNGDDQVIRDRRERSAGLWQLQPSLCLSLPLQVTMMTCELEVSICNTSKVIWNQQRLKRLNICYEKHLQGQFWSEVWFWRRGDQISELTVTNLSSRHSTRPPFRYWIQDQIDP